MTQRSSTKIRYLVNLAVAGGSLIAAIPGVAQLLPDSSLGAENSGIDLGVNAVGQPVDLITGGARRGANLFHSFQEFNIGNLQRVYFANPAGVETILSRVTGTNSSSIRGTLGVLGNANLFLINPNGIVFGPNATLDVRGSFIVSTASRILFADGTEFSAVNPSAPPLLTISVPIGLQFNGGEGDIVVQAGQFPELGNSFTEADDAGELPTTAQTVNSLTSGTVFDAISGTLSSATDVDLYQLFLTEGQPFTASTVGRTPINTELFLFDSNGAGISANDDSTGFQSTLPLYQPFIPTRSGIYYLGVSSYDINPRNLQGDIFDPAGNLIDSAAGLPLSEWGGRTGPNIRPNSGTYTISLTSRGQGLQVQPGSTLALVGRQVRLEGGRLQAPGGRVELAGVAGSGVVGLTQQGQEWRLSVPDGLASGDVVFVDDALVDVSAGGSGHIAIHAGNVNIAASSLLAGIAPELGFAGSTAGDIEITAAEAINLDASSVINDVAFGASGNAGNITLSAGSLSVTNGSGLYARTYGDGNAGNIEIQVRDRASFDYALAFSVVAPTGNGRGGDIRITADSVSLSSIAQLAALTEGAGDAGNVEINARDTVRLDGRDGGLATAVFTVVVPTAEGQGGDIRITAGSVSVTNGALLNASTFAPGNAGNIEITARDTVSFDGTGSSEEFSSAALSRVEAIVTEQGIVEGIATGRGGDIRITAGSVSVTNGAQLSVSTLAEGNAGNIEITARDAVTFDGTSRSSLRASAALSEVTETGSGNGGSITITSGSLLITNGAELRANSVGSGDAGSLAIEADAIQLGNQGTISADTTAGGGNINVRSPLLSLRSNSNITTNATDTATGGNIDINAGFIVSAPNENNDIIANAFAGSGGQITLTAQNIFWFDFRTRQDLQRLLNTSNPNDLDPRRLPTNDVTAFSQFNPTIDTGAVIVQTPDLDPTRGLITLPTDLTDPSQLIASTCPADKGNSFAITGRGGLPEDPRQPLVSQVIWRDERGRERGEVGAEERGEVGAGEEGEPIVEAQGWIIDDAGTVVLVARQSQAQWPLMSWHSPCSEPRQ